MYVFRDECLAVDHQLVHASLGKTTCPALSFPQLTVVHCAGLRPLVQFVKFIGVLLVHLTTNKNSELLSPFPVDTSFRDSSTRGSGNITEEGVKHCKTQRIKTFAVRLCLLAKSEAFSIKSHQQDIPNWS